MKDHKFAKNVSLHTHRSIIKGKDKRKDILEQRNNSLYKDLFFHHWLKVHPLYHDWLRLLN